MYARTWLLASCVSISAMASEKGSEKVVARLGQVAIQIPAAMSGPRRQFPAERSEIDTYVSTSERPPTVIQINRTTVPDASLDLSENDRFKAASSLLKGYSGTFGEKVTNWSEAPVEKVRLGGLLGARTRWTGNLHGVPATGTMYFVVVGKDCFFLHAFGSSIKPHATLDASVQAIETLRLESPDYLPK